MIDDELSKSVAEATASVITESDAAEVLAALREAGVSDALADDRPSTVRGLFGAVGRSLGPISAFDLLVAPMTENDTLLLSIPLRQALPFGPDGQIQVDGAVRPGAPMVVLPTPAGLIRVPMERFDVDSGPGFDSSAGVVRCSGIVRDEEDVVQEDWSQISPVLERAAGYMILGAAGSLLDAATHHVRTRAQFGHPLSAFQVVRHRLAEVRTHIDGATDLLDASWASSRHVASAAARRASLAGDAAVRHCLQVVGAMGFTAEMGLHRSARRIIMASALLGVVTTAREASHALFEREEWDLVDVGF